MKCCCSVLVIWLVGSWCQLCISFRQRLLWECSIVKLKWMVFFMVLCRLVLFVRGRWCSFWVMLLVSLFISVFIRVFLFLKYWYSEFMLILVILVMCIVVVWFSLCFISVWLVVLIRLFISCWEWCWWGCLCMVVFGVGMQECELNVNIYLYQSLVIVISLIIVSVIGDCYECVCLVVCCV